MSKFSYTPTFLLKGIDHNQLMDRYRKGEFNVPLSSFKKTIGIKETKIKEKASTNTDEPVYRVDNFLPNIRYTFHTTNCKPFIEWIKEGTERETGNCRWCNRPCKVRCGIPISLKLVDESYVIYYTSRTCSLRCSFAIYLDKYRNNPIFNSSEHYLKFLYYADNPGVLLRPSPDSDLLICNGGSLTDEEYDEGENNYMPIPSLIYAPLKFQSINLTHS